MVVVCSGCCRLHAGFRTYAPIRVDIRLVTVLIKKKKNASTSNALGLCVNNALFNEKSFFFHFKYSGRKVKSLLM